MGLVQKIFGTHSQHELKRIYPIADKVESYREEYGKLSDEQLRGKTKEFKERLSKGETLNDLLPEAYATVREAAKRVLGMEHYRVQIIGGIILHQGRIAEMRTGEGKTLVCTLPAYLNALEEKGVLVVTVNDYLAKRDAEWMGQVHNFLGLSVGIVLHDMKDDERRAAYASDITYVTNNELGFDYLRDNMAIYKEQLVLRDLHYCIIDEVDSVLIDEARTPLIISGQSGKSTKLYELCDVLARQLVKGTYHGERTKMQVMMQEEIEEDGDFIVNEKDKVVNLTEQGVHKVEQFFHIDNYADIENLEIQHNVTLALRAHYLMFRDKDYVVKDDEVLIVDEFTGRIMPGRRYSDGLHQAIEAKEHVKVKRESKTLATITFQNFFNKFDKKAGMTGTALTEEKEFRGIYNMDVVEVPTNKPIARIDHNDAVFKTMKGKFNAVIEQVIECHKKGQPVLVGTVSVEKSEYLSRLLKNKGIKHEVLNAKHHDREAMIVAQAGKYGAVTIATNMAGRGTDIMLGGNAEYKSLADLQKMGYSEEVAVEAAGFSNTQDEEVLAARAEYKKLYAKYSDEVKELAEKVREAGGLYIIGTERHESRRIDNQLRGRAGRQGDPGESRFYISLEDNLMRLFAQETLMNTFNRLGVGENDQIEHKLLSNAIETAQKKIETNNYGIRLHLLEYDQVMNEQREIMYAERKRVLNGESMRNSIMKMITDFVEGVVNRSVSEDKSADEWNYDEINELLLPTIPIAPVAYDENIKNKNELIHALKEKAVKFYEDKEALFPEPETIREIERVVLLKVIDRKWMDHIDDMDQLKQGIGLQAYGQKDPVVQYKMMGYDMFDEMTRAITEDTVRLLMHIQVEEKVEREQVAKVTGTNKDEGPSVKGPVRRTDKKIYPNDLCPCGSGKKYKNCCGRQA